MPEATEATYIPPKVWQWNKPNGGAFANINRPTAGARFEKELPVGRHPLQLYSLATPNGVKVTILLEELLALGHTGAEYDAWLIRISDSDQFGSGFVAVNPNSKIPALLDRSGPTPIRVFEGGHTLEVNDLAFTSDGKRLLSSSEDATMVLWDVDTGQALKQYQHPDKAEIRGVAILPGDTQALSTGANPDIIRWDLETGQPIDRLAQDPKAVALGRSIFSNTCATCHGSTGQGATGYPNLTDDIWHWGGTPERILETVLDGREGVMPEWGTVLTGMGGPEAVDYTIAYVRTLSAPETLQNNFMAARGQKLFDANCAVCHKADGKGAGQFPALDGSAIVKAEDHAAQLHLVLNGKGQMPAWKGVLKDSEIAAVVTYTKNAWSNKTGQLIQPAEVVAERAK